MNAQQVLPRAKVTVESHALRDLVACDYLALNGLIARVWSLADWPVLLRFASRCRPFARVATIRNRLESRITREYRLSCSRQGHYIEISLDFFLLNRTFIRMKNPKIPKFYHYTNSLDTLSLILRNGFRPQYSLRRLHP